MKKKKSILCCNKSIYRSLTLRIATCFQKLRAKTMQPVHNFIYIIGVVISKIMLMKKYGKLCVIKTLSEKKSSTDIKQILVFFRTQFFFFMLKIFRMPSIGIRMQFDDHVNRVWMACFGLGFGTWGTYSLCHRLFIAHSVFDVFSFCSVHFTLCAKLSIR